MKLLSAPRLLILLICLCAISLYFTIIGGEISINHSSDDFLQTIIWQLRLPRALNAFAVGGLLALAGALLQVMLNNPLADPYILGAAGGAAIGSLLLMLLGISGYWLNAGAFIGALLAMGLVFCLALRARWSALRLLLTGVVIASLWGALISIILTLNIDKALPPMLFWLIGDLSYAPTPLLSLIPLGLCLILSLLQARKLNILSRGDLQAQSLGINTFALNWQLYFLTALLTAIAVSVAGCIGFIGLIVPHLLRLLGQTDHRILLPGSVLLGGTLLMICDFIARNAFAPIQLPVGAITALIGAPFFLYLLFAHEKSL